MSAVGTSLDPLSLERLTVCVDRVVCDVVVAPGSFRMTTPTIVARVCDVFPSLPFHACVNDRGDTFAAVMDRTPLPHLLEHLVIDAQVRAFTQAERGCDAQEGVEGGGQRRSACEAVFVGTTDWVDEFAGRARIEVSFTDDLVALRAFRDMTQFLNNVVVS